MEKVELSPSISPQAALQWTFQLKKTYLRETMRREKSS